MTKQSKQSAGLLLYRRTRSGIEVLLAHPGGPFWTRKDDGVWTIPKGLFEPGEDPLDAAMREFEEETGCAPAGDPLELGRFRQPSGKVIHAWALEGDWDPALLKSNMFSLEWPPRSGRVQEFPEVDRAAWLAPDAAARKLVKGQVPILEVLLAALAGPQKSRNNVCE